MYDITFKDGWIMRDNLWASEFGARYDTAVAAILYNKYKIWDMLVTN